MKDDSTETWKTSIVEERRTKQDTGRRKERFHGIKGEKLKTTTEIWHFARENYKEQNSKKRKNQRRCWTRKKRRNVIMRKRKAKEVSRRTTDDSR